MVTAKFSVGQKVAAARRQDEGRTGRIVEIDLVGGRARIRWDRANNRTWMAFNALKPMNDDTQNA